MISGYFFKRIFKLYNTINGFFFSIYDVIIRWWKNLDFSHKLPFARDRVVECYFWILGVYFEPEYILARRILTKVIAMTSVIDDIYDVYGTIEELEIFTSAVER